mgnify:CR=1 FL=1
MFDHGKLERNSILMVVMILVVVAIGGIVEIVPVFYLETTIEKVKGMPPYSPLELLGRNIYVREGCYNCHSQMVRPFRDEIERYGHYSLAAESMYDHPFQWGSKRTGPDLGRVGGKYSDEWHRHHLAAPRSIVPESVMPGYPYLNTPLNTSDIVEHLKTNVIVGVPYNAEMVAKAEVDLAAQVDPDGDDAEALLERYPGAQVRDFDGKPGAPSEMDALIAYLQILGTMVDFSSFKAEGDNLR